MTKDKALQMCLEYIETDAHERKYVRHAIKKALAQPEPEPKFWEMPDGKIVDKWGLQFYRGDTGTPLYTTPQRTWVGLTNEEMRELEKQFEAERVRTSDEEYLVIYPSAYWQWQRAIEAKLRSKNT